MKSNRLRGVFNWAKRLPPWRRTSKSMRPVRRDKRPSPNRLLFKQIAPLDDRTLVFPPAKIGIIWSPKSACTKVVLWYFKLTGLLDAALYYHSWPHYYRMHVLYSSQRYGQWARNSDWENFTWYQFCRDPVSRLLSSYRHNLGFGYADDRISRALRRRVSYLEGYSLDDFLKYLETQDLGGAADPHVKQQWHRISKKVHINTINIDETDMFRQMNAIELKHNLPATDFPALEAFKADDRRRAKLGTQQRFSSSQILTHKDALGQWPLQAALLDPTTTDRIKRLYAADMKLIYPRGQIRPAGQDSGKQQAGELARG